MEKEQLLILAPGRELDVLVAEVVMGWKDSPDGFGETRLWRDPDGNKKADFYRWSPSTDISEAIIAAERSSGTWQLTKMGKETTGRQYRAIVGKNKNVAYAKTAAEAICKAALLAAFDATE